MGKGYPSVSTCPLTVLGRESKSDLAGSVQGVLIFLMVFNVLRANVAMDERRENKKNC